MKAMILAAGRGERMRPLTDALPKPLLEVGGRALIDYHLEALAGAGISEVVVNMAWQKQHLSAYLHDSGAFGMKVQLSDEGETALETGGGVFRALPLLGTEPFWLVNGDVYIESDFSAGRLPDGMLAHLFLVPNPPHNPAGDFVLKAGLVSNETDGRHTYSGVAILHPQLFAGCSDGVFSLVPLLREAADAGRVSGELFNGYWCDVGTPERLAALDQRLSCQT
jgi:MurNAc alpha-1-phosphate uridylyltransferase